MPDRQRTLNQRQINILTLIAQGYSCKEIGQHYQLSESRVKHILLHSRTIMNAWNTPHLIAILVHNGTIQLDRKIL